MPRDYCARIQGVGGEPGSIFFVRHYVDDGILVEVQWFRDGRRCMRALRSLASDHFQLLGERGPDVLPLFSARKITNWKSRLEVLGWIIRHRRVVSDDATPKIAKITSVGSRMAAVADMGVAKKSFPV